MEMSKTKKTSLSIEFKDFQTHKTDNEKYLVVFSVNHDNAKLSIHFTIHGEFRFGGGINNQNTLLAWTNGATILYGIARATVMQITAQSLCPSLLIPTLMMGDLIKEHVTSKQNVGKKRLVLKS